MERKIRFWDESEQKMIYPGEEYEDKSRKVSIYGLPHQLVNDILNHPDYGHLVPLQYTGLNDSTGKGIYEGDVLEGNYAAPWDHEDIIQLKAIVKWKRAGWFLNNLNEPSYSGYLGMMNPKNHRIIGNQWENPKLIED